MADEHHKNKNWLWIGILIVVIVIVALVFISNSNKPEDTITCNSPYIKVGTSCCLDQNSNNICDSDEQPAQSKAYCGDGICQSNENCSFCSLDCGKCKNYTTIAISSFDYDKTTKKIGAFKVKNSNYGANWKLIVTGKDSLGNVQFTKEITPSITGFSTRGYCQETCLSIQVSEEIPYLSGGTMNIKLISEDAGVQAVGEYSYSQFDGDISFSLVYDHYDNKNEEVVYKLINNGKRIIPFGFTHYLFSSSSCGTTSIDSGWFVMIMLDIDKGGDGIASPGETIELRGSSGDDLYSGQTYCSKITYGFDENMKSKEIVFTV